METKFTIKDGPGLPGVSTLPAPSPVCFFEVIEGVERSHSACANFIFSTLRAVQPFEHCEYCQCWNGEPF